MNQIDMRSDTVTHPTPDMRKAMADAEVGDDVFGEDPTVIRLEELAADLLGKEAALFVSSGTMGNLVSLLTHCNRGDEVILGDQSHIFFYEQGGCAALGGIQPRTVTNTPDGRLELQDIEAAIRPDDVHMPRSRLIALENTHNRCHGTPLAVDYVNAVGQLASTHKLRLHVDGARIFNAAIALGVDVKQLVAPADSVSICLSKGLAAPVGSVICGSRKFITRARRNRKVVGGGTRQAGILAASGILALTRMVDRLAEDHAHAAKLARGLADFPGITIDPDMVKTNIVFFDLDTVDPALFTAAAAERGVRVMSLGPKRLRAVTNYHVTEADIDQTLAVFDAVLKEMGGK